jgi:hypothetical protein
MLEEGLIATRPVPAEALRLIVRRLGVEPAAAVAENVAADDLAVCDLRPESPGTVAALMRRYADLPMDLADASLVLWAESPRHGRSLTTSQRDLRADRRNPRQPFKSLLG